MRLVREAERRQITGVPRSSWYAEMAKGNAPKPVPLGKQSVAWIESELLEWVQARIQERDSA